MSIRHLLLLATFASHRLQHRARDDESCNILISFCNLYKARHGYSISGSSWLSPPYRNASSLTYALPTAYPTAPVLRHHPGVGWHPDGRRRGWHQHHFLPPSNPQTQELNRKLLDLVPPGSAPSLLPMMIQWSRCSELFEPSVEGSTATSRGGRASNSLGT